MGTWHLHLHLTLQGGDLDKDQEVGHLDVVLHLGVHVTEDLCWTPDSYKVEMLVNGWIWSVLFGVSLIK